MEARYVATVLEAAREFGCHKQTVAQRLRARRVVLGDRIAERSDIERFVQWYASGLSRVKVERTGFSEKSVMTGYVRKAFSSGIRTGDRANPR